MRLQYYLNELFDSKVKIQKLDSKKGLYYIYEFKIHKNIYNVVIDFIDDEKNSNWEINFKLLNINYSATGITGTGHAFELFATVIKCIENFVKIEKPIDNIEMEAKSTDLSRVKLYDKLIKSKAKKFGYKLVSKKSNAGFTKYKITKINK